MAGSAPRASALAQGGLLAGIAGLLALAREMLPVGGLLVHVAAVVPIVLVTARHGRRAGVAAATVASFLVAAVFGPFAAVSAWLSFLVYGVTVGWARRRVWGLGGTVGLAAALGFDASLVMLVESAVVVGINPFIAARAEIQVLLATGAGALLSVSRLLHTGPGLQARAFALLALGRAWLPQITVLAVLGALVAYAVGFALLCYAADRVLARRLGEGLPPLGLPLAGERLLGWAERNLKRVPGVRWSRGRGTRGRS